MAFIDKIYGTMAQYDELKEWCLERWPELERHFYERDWYRNPDDRPICNMPHRADVWLWHNCPFAWVQEALLYQYGGRAPDGNVTVMEVLRDLMGEGEEGLGVRP